MVQKLSWSFISPPLAVSLSVNSSQVSCQSGVDAGKLLMHVPFPHVEALLYWTNQIYEQHVKVSSYFKQHQDK
jgi:hypothetical protein